MLATISRKRPHFIENHMLTQIKSSNFKKYIDLGYLGSKNQFWATWAQEIYQVTSLEPMVPISTKKTSFKN